MTDFIMMVGLPGSGKSTVAKQLAKKMNGEEGSTRWVVVSTDDIREMLCGSAEDQSQNAKVFDIAKKNIVEYLNAGSHVIFDATNVVSKKRIYFMQDICRRVKKPICTMSLTVCAPIGVCKERNSQRDRKVPEYAIDKMYKSFQVPQEYEGFDRCEYINNAKQDKTTHNGLDAITEKMCGFNQNTPYHKYDLLAHCRKVAEEFPISDVRHAAGWVHDYGKLFTQSTDENGVSHYYNHESVGAYEVMQFYVERNRGDSSLTEVLFYVNNHMHIRDIIKSKKAIQKYEKLWGKDRFNKLVEFMNADNKASGRGMPDGAG